MKFVITIEAEDKASFDRALDHAVMMTRRAPKHYVDTSYQTLDRSEHTWSAKAPDYTFTVERQA